jgi:hypothetical protein
MQAGEVQGILMVRWTGQAGIESLCNNGIIWSHAVGGRSWEHLGVL